MTKDTPAVRTTEASVLGELLNVCISLTQNRFMLRQYAFSQ